MATSNAALILARKHPVQTCLLVLLLFHVSVTSAFKLVDCKQDKAEQGAKWCKEAFGSTYSNNKLKILAHPKQNGCCLTMSLKSCVEYAFIKAKCDPKEQKIALLIKDQIKDAQKFVQSGIEALTSAICGDFRREECDQHFLTHFNQAIHNITVLNGSGALRSSVYAISTTAIVGTLYAMRWY